MKQIFLFVLLINASVACAQSEAPNHFSFNAYAEMYYSYDFSEPPTKEKSDFLYNHKRHNELNANLILVQAAYTGKNVRANVGLMAGNYATYNLSAEPAGAKYIYEANVGIKLSKKKKLWLDAGVFPSHIGYESAIGATCWNLTRSLAAENSPYYETGLKLGYTGKKDRLNMALFLLNGWQRIHFSKYNQIPSVGYQINYKASKKLLLNYSNFIGTAQADSLKALRTFHNFYAIYEHSSKWGLIAGLDIGTDKINPTQYGVWFTPNVVFRYVANDKIKMALRGEYYFDDNQIIVRTNTINGFQIGGVSANVDYQINDHFLWRLEGKSFVSKDAIFRNSSHENYSVTTSFSIKF